MEQLYVTLREQRHSALVGGEWVCTPRPPLGFAARHDLNSEKCMAKNEAQRKWAKYEYDATGNFIRTFNHRRIWADGSIYSFGTIPEVYLQQVGCNRSAVWEFLKLVFDSEPLNESLKPRVVDNVPRSGFKIVDTVTRYSTSNKLWRILDPYGFELEISTANMEEIIMGGLIDKGEIIGQCIWDFGKNGIGKAHLNRI